MIYGQLDASFKAAGEEEGVRKLVDAFYDYMEAEQTAQKILTMHPADLSISRDKLYCFLCGWLGGPRLFREKYGPISIPQAHQHLEIGEVEKEAWLYCMEKAINDQGYDEAFKKYLLVQLAVPANRVVNA